MPKNYERQHIHMDCATFEPTMNGLKAGDRLRGNEAWKKGMVSADYLAGAHGLLDGVAASLAVIADRYAAAGDPQAAKWIEAAAEHLWEADDEERNPFDHPHLARALMDIVRGLANATKTRSYVDASNH